MLPFINKIITMILVPIYMCPVLPFVHVAKLFNLPTELVSLSKNGVGTEEDPVYLTAHRGVWALAPQNSLPSYEAAVELGYYTAECDIRLTKDNEWVLIHNSEAESQFCQFGEISDYTLEELKTFSYKGGKNFWKYDDLKIATLDEYLDVFVGTETRPQIEIKVDGNVIEGNIVAPVAGKTIKVEVKLGKKA